MLYCEDCQQLVLPDGETCPDCEGQLRPPRENDPVLLVSADQLKADMIEPVIQDLGIPYSRTGDLGAAFTMRAGGFLETYRFYVPYGAYARAHDEIAEVFGEDPEIMQALR